MRNILRISVKKLFKRVTRSTINIPLNVSLRTTYKSNIDELTKNQINNFKKS